MEWGRVMVPLAGTDADGVLLGRAASVAGAFDAELACIYAPPDPAELTPWLGEGFVGGIQVAAVESLKEAAVEGEKVARATFKALKYDKKTFTALHSPVWRGLEDECRLADLVVFDDAAAKGRGPFTETFEQVLMEERAATLVSREGCDPFGPAMVAWDGGEPASRAARRAVPLLAKCKSVTIVCAPVAGRTCEGGRLKNYYAARGLKASVKTVDAGADPSHALLEAAAGMGASLLVAGAFGKSRVREFIFGGTTRALLNAERPSLFLAH